ncbi:MAG TPA: ABC transporter transmembrane domain-containing protein, partial [Corynebacterium sp.]|nr:ABC transporter transmembrane domain-containing protein [Corynebacterium sp.]
MIRSLLRLVPKEQSHLIPRYATAVLVLGIAQGLAFSALAPLLSGVFAGHLDVAWRWTIVVLVMLLIVCLANYLQAMAGMNIGVGMMRLLRTRLGDHLGSLPLGWFSTQTTATASRVMVHSTAEIMNVFAHMLTPVITAVVTPLTVAVVMLFVDWRVSLTMFLAAPVLYLVNRAGNALFAQATVAQHRAGDEANQQIIEFAQAQPVLRVFGNDQAHDRQLVSTLRSLRVA